MSAKRNRLTDLKCGWKNGTDSEIYGFDLWAHFGIVDKNDFDEKEGA